MRIPYRQVIAAVTLGFALFSARPGYADDALGFFKNYFVTGDYVVGGVVLSGTGENGIATGDINIGGVPPESEILAAFLYWQIVTKKNLGPDSGAVGATFKGVPLSSPGDGFSLAKVLDPAGTAPCWSGGGGTGKSSGGSHRTYTYRADVLRFLSVDPVTGKHIVNGPHTVQVPDSGGGNGVPNAQGASLVVVYRLPDYEDPNADPPVPLPPLSAIVIYDGGYSMNNSTQGMTQTIRGFYGPAGSGSGKLTHIVGAGQANKTERLQVGTGADAVSKSDVFNTVWENHTLDEQTPGVSFTLDMDPVTLEPVLTTSVDPGGSSSFDCLTWGAVIFRTDVLDEDDDGLLDAWEESNSFTDPDGQPLPNLNAMGASPQKDLFIEVGYLDTAGASLAYGGNPKPAHTHLPDYEALKMVGDAFKENPLEPINVHFDVGDNYQGLSGFPNAETLNLTMSYVDVGLIGHRVQTRKGPV